MAGGDSKTSKGRRRSRRSRPVRLADVEARLAALGGDVERSFTSRLAGIRRALEAGRKMERQLRAVDGELDRLARAREARAGTILRPTSKDLPIAAARSEILEAIERHPVVVLAGATGSGKTTQLPKMCLELGRGLQGMIAHTQPRRVAARSVAARIAAELGTPLGEGVGSAVRFERTTAASTRIKVMTDGVLLAETARDRDLLAYDTIIVDEAHERSLNIDFLLGYLKRLRRRREDLKLIITSATIDLSRFSEHFDQAPIIEVPGRTHPVDLRYRPVAEVDDDDADATAILDAIAEIDRGDLGAEDPSGRADILVFLPGEREIRDVAEAIDAAHLPDTEVLTLFARLSNEQQDRIFRPGDRRRIVLATNVAETSLTVPRIRGVVDLGLARISRYSPKSRVQRLPIEPISRASADQRAGRCGRLSPGICIRLYEEADLARRPAFTAPEILRSNLAAVVLRMADLKLGDPSRFPFVEAPSARLLRDGYDTLRELGAVDADDQITAAGRRLAGLPVDPRIGRMILAGIGEGCLAEMLVVAAALTVADPRDVGGGRKAAHQIYRDPRSDFLGYLRLWNAWQAARAEKGSSALRSWCRRQELSHRRLQEWQSLEGQLRALAVESLRTEASGDRGRRGRASPSIPPLREEVPAGAIHRSILAGLIAHVGRREEDGSYRGIGGGTFHIFPGSVLHRERPEWIVCAEIVETTKRWGRTCARIRADWIERVAPHLVRRNHFEPHFVPETGFVCAYERVSCGELDPTERRRVPFAPIDPAAARQVFIQEALVGERLTGDPSFLRHNRETVESIRSASDRIREDRLLDEDVRRFEFYDRHLPADVHNAGAFDSWRRRAERRDPGILRMSATDFGEAEAAAGPDYPDHLDIGGLRVELSYRHDPGHPEDGVTARVPLELLGRLDAARFEWLVPGLLQDKVEALVRTLPKRIRTRLMPIAETASGAAEHLDPDRGGLLETLASHLSIVAGLEISPRDFRIDLLEPHHLIRFVVVDEAGRTLESGRDYRSLLRRHHSASRSAFEAVAHAATPDGEAQRLATIQGRRDWDFGPLPSSVLIPRSHGEVTAHPGLVDVGDGVDVRLTDDPRTADAGHRRGVRRLLAIANRDALDHHLQHLPNATELAEKLSTLLPSTGFADAIGDLTLQVVMDRDVDLASVRDRPSFTTLDDLVRRDLWPGLERAVDILRPILTESTRLRDLLAAPSPAAWAPILEAERRHFATLVPDDLLAATPRAALERLPVYIDAGVRRIERLRGDGLRRDAPRGAEFDGWWTLYATRHRELASIGRSDPDLDAFRWLLEDYRVQLHAPERAAGARVSVAGLKDAWRRIVGRPSSG